MVYETLPRHRATVRLALSVLLAAVLAVTGVGLSAPDSASAASTWTLSGQIYLGEESNPAPAGSMSISAVRADDLTVIAGVSAVSTAGGRYVVSGLPDQIAVLVVFAYSGSGQYLREVRMYQVMTRDATLTVGFSPAWTISGHVDVDQIGTAPAASRYQVAAMRPGAPATEVLLVRTDSTGGYRLDGLPAGSYLLRFVDLLGDSPTWYWPASRSADTAGSVVISAAAVTSRNVVIPNGAGIVGHVSDRAGAPLGAVSVTAVRQSEGPGPQYTAVQTAADGSYRISGLDPGDYRVNFFAYPHHAADSSSLVSVSSGQRFSGIDAALYRGATVSVYLSSPPIDGGSTSGKLWRLDPSTGQWVEAWSWLVQNFRGWYDVVALPPGRYRVEGIARNRDQAVSTFSAPFDLAEGEIRDAVVQFSPPADIGVVEGTTAFIRALYQDYLGRQPGPAELEFWYGQLRSGRSLNVISEGFVNSDEFRLIRIDAAYREVLGRGADAYGRGWWLDRMRAGLLTTDDIQQSFRASDEYFAQAQARFPQLAAGNRRWVAAIYDDLLHRPVDATGSTFWSERAVRTGRLSVVKEFWNSAETASGRVAAMYAGYLGRAPDPSGLQFWTDLDIRWGDSATRSAFTSSVEYRRLSAIRFPYA